MSKLNVWSTEGLAERQAMHFWNDAVSSAFLDVRTERVHSAQPFRARLQSLAIGSLSINTLDAQSYRVHHRASGAGSDEWVFVNLHQAGRCRLRQNGREQWISDSDVSLNLGTTAFEFEFGDGVAMACLRLPLSGIKARTARLGGAVAHPFGASAGSQLFMGYANALVRHACELPASQAEEAVVVLMDLLSLAIGGGEADESTHASARRELVRRACSYLDSHLGDPTLDLARVAASLGLAPRTLQALFQEQGLTFTHSLLERRLLAAERQLTDGRSVQVSEVAYAVGFSDLSYFNRAFRRRFGMTPRERRAR
jgi:AraC family transcriptional activator of tynA and feaB